MRTTHRNWTRPKILKKYWNIKSTNQNEHFPIFPKKNIYLVTHKSVKEPKICMGATWRNLQAQTKIIKIPNLPNRTKILLKKRCVLVSYHKSVKDRVPTGKTGFLRNIRTFSCFRLRTDRTRTDLPIYGLSVPQIV
jgi:hypothetical protein